MINKWLKTVLLGVLAVILIQCSSTDVIITPVNSQIQVTNEVQYLDTQPISDPQGSSNESNDTQMTPTVSPLADSGLQSLIDLAKEDLAQRLSISIDQIILVEAKEVVWPDASLGCPQPGMKYKQVPEDGTRIILQVDGINYYYHYGGSRGLFLCEQVLNDPNKPTPIDITKLIPAALDKNNPPTAVPDNGIPPGEDQ